MNDTPMSEDELLQLKHEHPAGGKVHRLIRAYLELILSCRQLRLELEALDGSKPEAGNDVYLSYVTRVHNRLVPWWLRILLRKPE